MTYLLSKILAVAAPGHTAPSHPVKKAGGSRIECLPFIIFQEVLLFAGAPTTAKACSTSRAVRPVAESDRVWRAFLINRFGALSPEVGSPFKPLYQPSYYNQSTARVECVISQKLIVRRRAPTEMAIFDEGLFVAMSENSLRIIGMDRPRIRCEIIFPDEVGLCSIQGDALFVQTISALYMLDKARLLRSRFQETEVRKIISCHTIARLFAAEEEGDALAEITGQLMALQLNQDRLTRRFCEVCPARVQEISCVEQEHNGGRVFIGGSLGSLIVADSANPTKTYLIYPSEPCCRLPISAIVQIHTTILQLILHSGIVLTLSLDHLEKVDKIGYRARMLTPIRFLDDALNKSYKPGRDFWKRYSCSDLLFLPPAGIGKIDRIDDRNGPGYCLSRSITRYEPRMHNHIAIDHYSFPCAKPVSSIFHETRKVQERDCLSEFPLCFYGKGRAVVSLIPREVTSKTKRKVMEHTLQFYSINHGKKEFLGEVDGNTLFQTAKAIGVTFEQVHFANHTLTLLGTLWDGTKEVDRYFAIVRFASPVLSRLFPGIKP